MMEILRVKWKVCLERSTLCFDVAEDVQALFVPLVAPCENR
jgi:hypothetical protein